MSTKEGSFVDYELEMQILFPGAFALKNKVDWFDIHYGSRILGVGMTKDDAWKNAHDKWKDSMLVEQ